MLYPDSQTARALVRYRQDAYERELALERLARPLVERRRQERRRLLARLLAGLSRSGRG